MDDDIDVDDNWLYDSCLKSSKLSVKDHGAAALGLIIRHNCSKEAAKDLLQLLNIHLPENHRGFKSLEMLRNTIGKYG